MSKPEYIGLIVMLLARMDNVDELKGIYSYVNYVFVRRKDSADLVEKPSKKLKKERKRNVK